MLLIGSVCYGEGYVGPPCGGSCTSCQVCVNGQCVARTCSGGCPQCYHCDCGSCVANSKSKVCGDTCIYSYEECCTYTAPESEDECGGGGWTIKFPCDVGQCCGWECVTNPETQECCGGNVIAKCDPDECEECDGEGACEVCNGDPDKDCCGGTCYDKATEGCCDGVIYDKATKCCDNGTVVDKCTNDDQCDYGELPDGPYMSCPNMDPYSNLCADGVEGSLCNHRVIIAENSARCADCAPNCDKERISACAEITPVYCVEECYLLACMCHCYQGGEPEYRGNHYECN